MPKIITRDDSKGVAYPYAYDANGDLISVDSAVKIINGQKEKYYLFQDLSCELVLAAGEIRTKHFRTKPDSYIKGANGAKIPYQLCGETEAHIRSKQKIAMDKQFEWQGHVIRLKSARIESKLFGSTYYADCRAELLDGTPCVIEVILSSETSEAKQQFLKEAQILTFEIHIDRNGNTITNRFNIYGNRQIEQIQNEIAETERRILKGNEEVGRIRKRLYEIEPKFQKRDERLRRLLREHESSLEANFRRWQQEEERRLYGMEAEGIPSSFGIREEIEHTIQQLRSAKQKHQRVAKGCERLTEIRTRIERTTEEITALESTFTQAAERCSVEWYTNSWVGTIRGERKIQSLLHYTS